MNEQLTAFITLMEWFRKRWAASVTIWNDATRLQFEKSYVSPIMDAMSANRKTMQELNTAIENAMRQLP